MSDTRKRETVSVTLCIVTPDKEAADGKKRRWLDSSGEFGATTLDEAAVLVFQRSPMPAETFRITALCHDLAGGLPMWVELERAADSARKQARKELEAQVWPEGRPEAEGVALLKQETALSAAWRRGDTPMQRAYESMMDMLERLRFTARWDVLVVDAPPGWRKLSERPMDEITFHAVWDGWLRGHTEVVQGKAQPSAQSKPALEGKSHQAPPT